MKISVVVFGLESTIDAAKADNPNSLQVGADGTVQVTKMEYKPSFAPPCNVECLLASRHPERIDEVSTCCLPLKATADMILAISKLSKDHASDG